MGVKATSGLPEKSVQYLDGRRAGRAEGGHRAGGSGQGPTEEGQLDASGGRNLLTGGPGPRGWQKLEGPSLGAGGPLGMVCGSRPGATLASGCSWAGACVGVADGGTEATCDSPALVFALGAGTSNPVSWSQQPQGPGG